MSFCKKIFCHNPFRNQVYFAGHGVNTVRRPSQGHNPFRNQVYFALARIARVRALLRVVTIPLEIRSILPKGRPGVSPPRRGVTIPLEIRSILPFYDNSGTAFFMYVTIPLEIRSILPRESGPMNGFLTLTVTIPLEIRSILPDDIKDAIRRGKSPSQSL